MTPWPKMCDSGRLCFVTLILATNNEHKRRELGEILADHELLLPAELGLRFTYDETGTSFHENALGKAHALFDMIRDGATAELAQRGTTLAGVIADDSGISVDALDGRPGIYSARYGSPAEGPDLEDAERNTLLLEELDGSENRRAHYTCCMALVLGRDRYYLCQETWHGEITMRPSDGPHGFGYDPIVYIAEEGLTVAEISPERKNAISHRGKAARDVAGLMSYLETESRLDDGVPTT